MTRISSFFRNVLCARSSGKRFGCHLMKNLSSAARGVCVTSTINESRFWVVINIWWIPNHLSQEVNSLISISVLNSRVFATRRVHITSFVGTSNAKKLTLNLKCLHCTGCRCLTACRSFRLLGCFFWALWGSQGLAHISVLLEFLLWYSCPKRLKVYIYKDTEKQKQKRKQTPHVLKNYAREILLGS